MKAKERSRFGTVNFGPSGLLRRALASERGIALPVSVTVLLLAGLLAAAASTSALTANGQSNRDRGVKRSVASADAGVNVAMYRLNKLAGVLTTSQPCPIVSGSTLTTAAVQADGWCAAQSETLGGGGIYSYRISGPQQVNVGGQNVWQREIVSSGTFRNTARRADATVNAPTGTPLFVDGVFSDLDLVLKNSATITGNARSNGNIITQNSSGVCGTATVGPGKEVRGQGAKTSCGGSNVVATEPFTMAPVAIPSPNNNSRITPGGGDDDPRTGSLTWSATTRALGLKSASITLQGSVYVLCSLTIEPGGKLIIPNDGTPVRIYFDSPANCGGAGTGGMSLSSSSSEIDNVSDNPTMLQFYFVGSKTIPTTISINNNHDIAATFYAPNSIFDVSNNNVITGAVAAKQVKMSNGSEIRYDTRVGTISDGNLVLPVYKPQHWIECTPTTTGTAPDSGC